MQFGIDFFIQHQSLQPGRQLWNGINALGLLASSVRNQETEYLAQFVVMGFIIQQNQQGEEFPHLSLRISSLRVNGQQILLDQGTEQFHVGGMKSPLKMAVKIFQSLSVFIFSKETELRVLIGKGTTFLHPTGDRSSSQA